jgi:hypothetical protein
MLCEILLGYAEENKKKSRRYVKTNLLNKKVDKSLPIFTKHKKKNRREKKSE